MLKVYPCKEPLFIDICASSVVRLSFRSNPKSYNPTVKVGCVSLVIALTLGRNTLEKEDTGNFTVPNKDWNMKAGDKFVLLNILMPQAYIRDAENRLLARAKEYLAKYSSTNYSYNVGVDEIFMARNVNFYNDIMEGKRLTVNDQEIGINNENIIIQSLTIKEGEGIVPTFEVTLNNETTASTLDRIQGQISEVETSVSNNFSSQSELLKQYRKKLDKSVWDSIFVIHKDDSENPEKITSVQSLVGLWTNEFLSAKGLNPGYLIHFLFQCSIYP